MGRERTDAVREREREYNRKYREKHPEKFIAQRARRAEAHRAAVKVWDAANPEKRKQYWAKWRRDKASYDGAKARAKRKGIEFTITREYLNSITPTHCPVLGMPLRSGGQGGPSDDSISIDRIDGTRGYVEGNIVVVSNKVNRIKNDATLDELKQVVQFYEQLLSSQPRLSIMSLSVGNTQEEIQNDHSNRNERQPQNNVE